MGPLVELLPDDRVSSAMDFGLSVRVGHVEAIYRTMTPHYPERLELLGPEEYVLTRNGFTWTVECYVQQIDHAGQPHVLYAEIAR